MDEPVLGEATTEWSMEQSMMIDLQSQCIDYVHFDPGLQGLCRLVMEKGRSHLVVLDSHTILLTNSGPRASFV
jgi:hypothetical protein